MDVKQIEKYGQRTVLFGCMVGEPAGPTNKLLAAGRMGGYDLRRTVAL